MAAAFCLPITIKFSSQMEKLVFLSQCGKGVTTSQHVAQVFGKEHKHVLRDIDDLSCSDVFRASNFGLMFSIRELPNGGSRKERYYEMTKDGFSFLVMGYTGEKASQFKEVFINEFNKREMMLKSDDYILARSQEILRNRLQLAEEQINALETQNREQDERITLMLPKVRTYEQVINSPQDEWLKTTSSVANEIGMSAQKLNKMLVACGIIYRTKRGEYLFHSDYLRWNLGKTVSVVVDEEKGKVRTYIKWTTRGRAYIHALHACNWNKRRAWHLLKEGKEDVAV